MHSRRFAYSLLLASAAVVGLASSAFSFTLTDDPSVNGTNPLQTIYYGGSGTLSGQDIIGVSPPFSIFSAVVTRTGSGVGSSLNIIINTNFAGAPGTGPADGTTYGSLFLNPLVWSATNNATTHYTGDNFVSGNQNWAYAVTTPSTGTGTSGLYATGLAASGASGAGSPALFSGVPQSYTTGNGQILLSNVSGNPIDAGAGFYFRQGQAVQYTPNNPLITVIHNGATSATVTTVAGSYIDYNIVDNGLLGNTFALAWDMTCANDAIQGLVSLAGNDLLPSPLPAALPLFAGGLGFIGLLAGRRKRKTAAATAAA
jgi:hypothetical protein